MVKQTTREEPVQDSSDITNLSATSVILLLVFVPAILLITLILVSYAISPWA